MMIIALLSKLKNILYLYKILYSIIMYIYIYYVYIYIYIYNSIEAGNVDKKVK